MSEGPSSLSPLTTVDQVVTARGTGWALELAGRSKLGSVASAEQDSQTRQRASQARQAM